MTSDPDLSMITDKPQVLPQTLTPPCTTEDMISSEASFQDMEKYYPPSQASPASTEVSEQDMIEAYEIVMEEVLSTIIRRLGISAGKLVTLATDYNSAWKSGLSEVTSMTNTMVMHILGIVVTMVTE